MAKNILIISGLVVSFFLGFFFKTFIAKQAADKTDSQQTADSTQAKRVVGIGGIFFKSTEPGKTREWYKTHLGFDINKYGARFVWQEGCDTAKKGSLQWCPFSETTNYFSPSNKDFMINYRVDNLTALVEQLKKEDVTIVDTLETYDYGKFIHIMDMDGNKIELYEPK